MQNENVNATNHRPNGRMTMEQQQHFRNRISDAFRAAKPLLDRKRPRETADFSNAFPGSCSIRDSMGIESQDGVTTMGRVPLMELPINRPSACSRNGVRTPDGKYSGIPCFTRKSLDRSEMDDETLDATVAAKNEFEKGFLSESFITLSEQPENSSLNDAFLTPSLLDDDFDEAILEEIDAICEESARKAVCRSSNIRSSVENQCTDNHIGNLAAGSDSGSAKSGLDHLVGFGLKEENVNSSHPTFSASMPDEYSKYLRSLNDRQREAACSDISVPLMIVAGPGSGKTSTMVGRVLVLLDEGIHPSNILAMTFTTAAASEMRERIGKVAGKKTAKELTISTFHSFSLQLCRSYAEKLERTSEFSIYGHGQQRRAIIEAVRLFENKKNTPTCAPCEFGDGVNGTRCVGSFKDKSKKWQKFVTQAKASGKTPADCRKMGAEVGAAILGSYNDILKSCNALDYHDLISCSVKLLNEFPEVFKESQDTWKAIIVDEFQDTSATQYKLLRILASHNHITIVGDDDQSIFSFNGADISGFDSFRKDFPNYKEVRLVKNYRSTRHIVEAASSIIQNNTNRCQSKNVLSENSRGSKITVKECHNEDAQCAFIIDKILESASDSAAFKCSYGSFAILYRRQVSGKAFQTAFRERKIPFNVHGVAFYRKKVIRVIVAMLRTTVSECDDGPYRRVFKALLPSEKEEKKRMIEHIDKISTIRKCSFISAACDIFSPKISGTFKRSQLTQGRKVLSTLEMISKLVQREQSLSAVVTSVANMVPQKYLLEQRAVLDADGAKLLNEDNDLRSVLQYLMDDVSDFLSVHFTSSEGVTGAVKEQKGCTRALKSFIDYISERETENFRSRRRDNEDSVTLTTIHQSKGLEWDVVFIVKANETEIPLLHEFNGNVNANATSLEEERRLLYVAMTRARKKLFILYVTVDSNWQVLQPSRFLKEIPRHLLEVQGELSMQSSETIHQDFPKEMEQHASGITEDNQPELDILPNDGLKIPRDASEESAEAVYACNGNNFLRRFSVEDRSIISHLFHNWARKQAFQDPRRLLSKVRFVIDERLTIKKNKNKDVLRALKSSLGYDDAFQYAEHVIRWEQIPADKRAHLTREKQEHFQKLRIENSMNTAAPTSKQIAYLQNLGCTVAPTSRLHASHLIEQYKSL